MIEMAEVRLPQEAERKSEVKPEHMQSLSQYSDPFWSMPWRSALHAAGSSEKGLKQSEATARLLKHGKNEIKEDGENRILRILLSQVMNLIVYVLLGAALISILIGDSQTAIIIVAIVVITSIIGFVQEYRSEKAVDKLKKYLTFTSRVLRSGMIAEIDSREIVPGDLVILSVGDRVPADLRLIETEDMSIDESVLTGEQYPVEKTASTVMKQHPIPQEMRNIAFAGSMVKEGKGIGVAIATGAATYFGKTALMLESVKDQSDFQKELQKFGGMLLKAILVSIFFVFVVNVYVGHGPLTSLLFAVTLAVGLVPEPLPFITTLLLSRGASKLADKGVIVKRLSATEDLGNVDILCCDKTGTLTENRVSLADHFDLDGKRDETPLLLGLQCSSAVSIGHHLSGNAIDVSLAEYARHHPHLLAHSAKYDRVFELPFDYERRRMSVVIRTKGADKRHIMVCKGAPEAVLAVSSHAVIGGKVTDIRMCRKKVMEKYVELSEKGYRAIAVAIREVRRQDGYTKQSEKEMTLLGFITFIDPPRRSSKDTLDLAKKYGIRIKILTGDGSTVTRAIANRVGFDIAPEQVIVGSELDDVIEKGDMERIENAAIFARVTPDQKFRVIKLLRSRGHVVAFLGDGVNDAPPLAEADVGISVQSGADIAKEAADVVLTRKNLHSIIDGILIGRGIFANIVKYIRCTFAGNFGNLYTVALSSMFLRFIPMLPAQILLINFLTDTPLLTISTDNVDEEELRKPRKWNIGQITRNGAIFGVISTIFDLIIVAFLINASESLFQSVLFLEVVFSEIFVIVSLRTMKPFVLAKPPSVWVLLAIAAVAVIGTVAVFPPLAGLFGFETPVMDLIVFAALVAVGYALVTEMAKYIMYRHLWQNQKEEDAKAVAESE
ncbi:putative copper-exporting P-type ATPase A [uncultured archaeon]|nr:putative copper-exporting P-type ATPase A [uncultured archaeon]